MGIGHRTIRAVLASSIATLAFVSLATAQERAGVVTTLEGKVTVVRASAAEPSPLKFRDNVFVRDRIATDKDSFARVLLGGRAVVTIREYSTVTITEVPGVATVDVASGRVAVAVARERMRPGDLVEVRTPNAVAGIRGTVIVAEVFDPRHSVITVLKGVIDVTRLDAGRLVGSSTILNALQQVTIGGAVSSPQPISGDTARSMRDEFRTVPPRSAPNATTAAVSQGEMERVSKDLGVDRGKSVQTVAATTVATTSDDTMSGTQAAGASGTASAAPSGSAPATSSAAPSGSTPPASSGGPAANTPAASSAGPVANTPAASNATPVANTSATPVATAPAMPSAAPAAAPVASVPSATSVSSVPATPGPVAAGPTVVSPVSTPAAPAVMSGGNCACVTAISTPSAASLKDLKDLGDLGNSLGLLKDLKADKADRDTGKGKRH
jgi:hypothetical protein